VNHTILRFRGSSGWPGYLASRQFRHYNVFDIRVVLLTVNVRVNLEFGRNTRVGCNKVQESLRDAEGLDDIAVG
jgi:hypothetical protein